MRARLYICDVCGDIEDKVHGGAWYIFRYKQKLGKWYERHKMVMCHECFQKMLAFCSNDEEAEWEESEVENETDN